MPDGLSSQHYLFKIDFTDKKYFTILFLIKQMISRLGEETTSGKEKKNQENNIYCNPGYVMCAHKMTM